MNKKHMQTAMRFFCALFWGITVATHPGWAKLDIQEETKQEDQLILYGNIEPRLKKLRQEVIDLEGHSLSIALEENRGRPGIFDPDVILTELIYDGHDLLAGKAGTDLKRSVNNLWKAHIGRIYCDVSGPPNGCALTIQILALQAHEPWGEERGRQCYITIVSKDSVASECRLWGEEYALPARADYGTARPALRRVRFEANDIAERSLILEVEEKEGPYKFFYPTVTPTVIMLDGEDITGTIADGVIRNSLQDFGDITIHKMECIYQSEPGCQIYIQIYGTVIDPPPGALNTGGCSISIISKDETKGRCSPDYPEPENEW